MIKVRIRGLLVEEDGCEEKYFSQSDLYLWLAAFGEIPEMTDDQRLVVASIIANLREAEQNEERIPL